MTHADLELEVVVAASAEARLAQERTQRWVRRVAGLTALVLIALSAATLVYVVTAVGRSSAAAAAAAEAAKGNRELLQLQRDQVAARLADNLAAQATDDRRVADALVEAERRQKETDDRLTAQLQVVVDLLVAELRAPENQERPQPSLRPSSTPGTTPKPSTGPGARPAPAPAAQPPAPRLAPVPSPSPTRKCKTKALGICLRPGG